MEKRKRDYRGRAARDGLLQTRVGWARGEAFVELAKREGVTVSEALARLVTQALLEGRLPRA